MGVIVNPRGAGGTGKTELVRRLLADYGWPGGGLLAETVRREGRARALAYRLPHPLGGRPLAVLGHYEATSGGCDTIRVADGGMDEVFRLAHQHAACGHDVLLEGLRLSGEYPRSAALARAHALHVLRLSTPLDRCVRNLLTRRRRSLREGRAGTAASVAAEDAAIAAACARLGPPARVEVLDFEAALLRARELLGLRAVWTEAA